MGRVAGLVFWVVVSVLAVGGVAEGQSPAAPAIESVTAADGGLVVVWAAPVGVVGVTSYDLRFIRSGAVDRSDSELDGCGRGVDRFGRSGVPR